MPLPLEGVLVVSLEQAVAAPMCSCRLADAGARVIKIERPEGDFARGYDALAQGQSTYFVWLNRGKESLVLDLTKADDKALLEAMLAKADVFIQNLKPGAVTKLGFAIDFLYGQPPFYGSVSRGGACLHLRFVHEPVFKAGVREEERPLVEKPIQTLEHAHLADLIRGRECGLVRLPHGQQGGLIREDVFATRINK